MIRLFQWEIILVLELFKYLIGYFISRRESVKIKKSFPVFWGIFLLIPVILFNVTWATIDDAYIVFFLVAIVSVVVIMDIPIRSRVWQIMILFLCISSLDGVFSNLLENTDLSAKYNEELIMIIWSTMTGVLLSVILALKKLVKKYFSEKSELINVTLAQVAMIFSGICQCYNATAIANLHSGDKKLFPWVLASYLGVAFLGSQIWVVINLNSRMKALIKEERVLHTTQEEYYRSLLDREDETRKYRHDMTNHLMVMDVLLDEGNLDELKEYLGKLRDEFDLVQNKRYVTGNPVIDAISCYYLPGVADFTDISVRGHISTEIKIDEVSICTIYSNLVKNAVEELQRLKEDAKEGLKLLICFKTGKDFIEINVANSMRDNAVFRGINTPTSKSDSKNHGIGLGNIKRTVEREHGRIKIDKKDQMFVADVILPVK